jgi:hypothetical protein
MKLKKLKDSIDSTPNFAGGQGQPVVAVAVAQPVQAVAVQAQPIQAVVVAQPVTEDEDTPPAYETVSGEL